MSHERLGNAYHDFRIKNSSQGIKEEKKRKKKQKPLTWHFLATNPKLYNIENYCNWLPSFPDLVFRLWAETSRNVHELEILNFKAPWFCNQEQAGSVEQKDLD